MAHTFKHIRNHKFHKACRDGSLSQWPFEEVIRVTGNLTHNYKQFLKLERRMTLRAADRREVASQLAEMD